jgi:ATP-dependent Clp protease adaptor protein ClpS
MSQTTTKLSSKTKPRPRKPRRKPLRPWHVVLIDDNQHTYAYVIEMLGRVCRHPLEKAMRMAIEVDTKGRVIVFTGHKELAELKREQILAYGHDIRIASCQGSMTAVVQEA